jgi:hypothetical protein
MVNTPNVPFIQTPDLARRHGQAINQMLAKTDPMSVSGTVTTLKTDFNLDTGFVYKIAGVQVLGPRITGWAADTGTDKRTANATYAAGATLTFTNPPTAGEMTALAARLALIEAALQNASRTQKSLKADLTTQGIIGA